MRASHGRFRALGVGLTFAVAITAVGCGGVTQFAGDKPFTLNYTKTPPPPPPPPPPPEPVVRRVEVTEDAIVITEKIQFEVNKDVIKEESFGLLDEIAGVFNDNLQIKKVDIIGHTDSDGSAKNNVTLSERRAAAVVAYLTEHKVAAERLTSKGLGEAEPMADNDTDEGKAKNRRVEFHITEQDEVKKIVEVVEEPGKAKGKKKTKKGKK